MIKLVRRQCLVRALAGVGGRRIASQLHTNAPLMRAHGQLYGALSVAANIPVSTRSLSSSSSTGFRCGDCGASFVKWQGQCSSCSSWGSIAPTKVAAAPLYRQSNASSFSHTHKKTKHNSHAVPWAGGEDVDDMVLRTVLRMNDVQGEAVTERIKLPERELVRLSVYVGGSRSEP